MLMMESSVTRARQLHVDPRGQSLSCAWPRPVGLPVADEEEEGGGPTVVKVELFDLKGAPRDVAGQLRKAKSSRRNAWGNLSYAELITRAIESAPDKRLTLSQIYDWMVRFVPYFKDKGDSNSSAGWKVGHAQTKPSRHALKV